MYEEGVVGSRVERLVHAGALDARMVVLSSTCYCCCSYYCCAHMLSSCLFDRRAAVVVVSPSSSPPLSFVLLHDSVLGSRDTCAPLSLSCSPPCSFVVRRSSLFCSFVVSSFEKKKNIIFNSLTAVLLLSFSLFKEKELQYSKFPEASQ